MERGQNNDNSEIEHGQNRFQYKFCKKHFHEILINLKLNQSDRIEIKKNEIARKVNWSEKSRRKKI